MRFASALVFVLLSFFDAAPGMQLAPRNESLGDESFQAFKAALPQVASECNERTMYGLLAADAGLRGRAHMWKEQVVGKRGRTGRLGLCDDLLRALPLGVARIHHEYCVPYPLCEVEVRNDTHASPQVVSGRAVVLREGSSDDSAPVETLWPWEVVDLCVGQDKGPCANQDPHCLPGWSMVGSARGKTGCVDSQRDLLWDTTCISFKKTPEGWRISGVDCYYARGGSVL